MKKLLWLINVISVVLIFMLPVAAEEFTSGDFTYTVNSDGVSVTIKDYSGTDTDLVIAGEVNGYSVASIGSSAFAGCSSLVSVTIPDSVTSIGSYAFSYCSSLSSVTIPDSVTSIGRSAFSNCSSLSKVIIPEGVTELATWVFKECSNLKTAGPIGGGYDIEFGWTTEIPEYALDCANYITSVVIPAEVTVIGEMAFRGCSNLSYITIPSSVVLIGEHAFNGCTNLKTAGPAGGGYNIEFNWITEIPAYAFNRANSLTSVVIPEGMTAIGKYAFTNCYSLIEVSIPSSMEKIGANTFEYCDSLVNITIPDGVTSLGSSLFWGCDDLEYVKVPASVTTIGKGAFGYCKNLTTAGPVGGEYNIEFGWTTEIPDYAFCDANYLTSIEIPDGIKVIGDNVFNRCDKLESIVIPDGVTTIGDSVFNYCVSLSSVKIPDSVIIFGSNIFKGCKKLLTAGYIGGSYDIEFGWTISIPDNAFYGADCIENVAIPDSVTKIGDSAFNACEKLENITLSSNLKTIGRSAFAGCNSFVDITLPSGINTIEEGTFYNCSSLTSVVIPSSVTTIGNSAFSNCSSLTDVYYTGTEEEWENISIGSDNTSLTSATIHYNCVITPELPETPEDIPGTVKYLYSWDSASGEAVLGVGGLPYSAADGAEIGSVTEGSFVLVVMNDSNFILYDSIKPVESRLGIVNSVDTSSVTIDSTAYPISKYLSDMFSSYLGSAYLCDANVLYHLNDGCIVGITVLSEKNGTFEEYSAGTGCLTIDSSSYYMNSLTDISFLASIGQVIGCDVSILTDGTFVYSLVQLDTDFSEVRKLESYDASTRTVFFTDGVSYLLADNAAVPGNDLIGSWVICSILNTAETGSRLIALEKIEPEFSVTVKMENKNDILFSADEMAFEGEDYISKTDFKIPFTVEIENDTYRGGNTSDDFINEEYLAISISSVEVAINPNDLKINIELDESVVLKPGEKLTGKGIISAGLLYKPKEINNFYSVTAKVKSSVDTEIGKAEFTIKKKDEWKFEFLEAFNELSVVEARAQSPVLMNYFTEETIDEIARTLSIYEFLRSGEVIEKQHCLKITCLMDKKGTDFEDHKASLYFWIPTGIMDVIPSIKIEDDEIDFFEGISIDQINFQMIDETKKAVLHQNELLKFSVSVDVSAVKSGLNECFKAVYDEEIKDFCYEVIKAGLSNVIPGFQGAGALSALETGKIIMDVYSDFEKVIDHFKDVFSFTFETTGLIRYPMDADIVTVSDLEQAVKKISFKTTSGISPYTLVQNEADYEIHIYDSNGLLCAAVNNDTLICTGDDTGLFVEIGSDFITLWMCGKDFTFDIVTSQTTTISYTIEEFNAAYKTRLVRFDNVELVADTTYNAAIPHELDIAVEKYAIISDKGDTISADRDLYLNGSGDVNDDGEITSDDAEILSHYFAGYQDSGIVNWNAADVNGDGVVTRQDAMIVRRHIAGWEGYDLPYVPVQ